MKIGVFVGSFDPIHLGHLEIINQLLIKHYVDKVQIIPTGNYWDKKIITSIDKRIAMLKLISNKDIIIDEENNNILYTYQILEKLTKENPQNKYILIIGADNANDLKKWKCYDILIKYPIIVITRDNIKINLKTQYMKIINIKIDISSTLIRNKIKNHLDVSSYLNRKVYNYIKQHKLYY